jgi:methylmalonyl-CoA/ethylmalonyl-CoA epimerase
MDLTLHHVGVLVEDISKAASFYLDSLGYESKSGVVHDPVQSAYVQFFKLPHDNVYLELVSPDRPDSKLSNALQKGGGLNHLCYSTGDIEAACIELRAAGLFLISRPVSAVAFNGRRIAWLRGSDRIRVELVERGGAGEL